VRSERSGPMRLASGRLSGSREEFRLLSLSILEGVLSLTGRRGPQVDFSRYVSVAVRSNPVTAVGHLEVRISMRWGHRVYSKRETPAGPRNEYLSSFIAACVVGVAIASFQYTKKYGNICCRSSHRGRLPTRLAPPGPGFPMELLTLLWQIRAGP